MLKIDVLKQKELNLLYKYSKLENWNIEKVHIECQYKIYPNDFFVAYKDKQLVGFIIAVRENKNFGFISTLIVLRQFRGLGYGKKIFQYALKHLGNRQIALDSIKGKEHFYKPFDFKSYFNVNILKFKVGNVTLPSSHANAINFDKKPSLLDVDEHMECIIKNKATKYTSIKISQKTISYGILFSYNDGYKIVIDSKDINEAISLFFELIKDLQNGVYIYMKADKLRPLFETMGELLSMKIDTQFTRMYNKII